MAAVLESVVGEWGKAFVSVGLIVSVLGAYLAWTLMAAEVLFVAAKDDDMPRFLARTRGADVPFPALLLSTILVQVMLVITLFSEDAFNFALDLTSALTLIPFLSCSSWPAASRAASCSHPPNWSSWPSRSSGPSSVSSLSPPAESPSEPP
jgi:arginine:ornithine antiporter / lysine permease